MSQTQTGLSDDLIARIESDIRKSGFPLEMYVLNVCSTKNTGRLPNVRYEYLDQLREIDLCAFFSSKRPTHYTSTTLIIECKTSASKPWVFFSTPSYKMEDVTFFLHYESAFDPPFAESRRPPLLSQIRSKMKNSYYGDASIPRCVSYYEAFRSTSERSEIYKAIDSVITYLGYRSAWRRSRFRSWPDHSDFYLPVVVLDGPLFEATVELDKVSVCARPHIQLRTLHREKMYVIDIVSREHFKQFFEQVEKFHEEVVHCLDRLQLPKKTRIAPPRTARSAPSRSGKRRQPGSKTLR